MTDMGTNNIRKDSFNSLESGAYEHIVEAARAGNFESVLVIIQRRMQTGHLSTVPGKHPVQIEELADWDTALLPAITGGGDFECTVFHPHIANQRICKFRSKVDGPPIFKPASMGRQGVAPASAAEQEKKFLDNLPAHQRFAYMAQQQGMAPMTTYASDQVLNEQLAAREAELKKIREERDAQAAEAALRLKATEERLAKMELEAERARADGQYKALEARIEEMNKVRNAPPPPAAKTLVEQLTELAPLLPFVMPVVQTWMTGKSAAEIEAQKQGQQMQQLLLAQVTAPRPDTTKDTLMALMPFAGPLIAKFMERQGPEQQAALFTAMMDMQMNSMSMVQQLIESTAPPPDTASGQLIRALTDGVQKVAMAYAASQGGLPGQLPAPPQPMGVLQNAPPPIYNSATEDEDGNAVDASAETSPPRAPRPKTIDPKLEALFDLAPPELKTQAWRTIFISMHTEPPTSVDEVATMITGHIESLISLNQLPSFLSMLEQHPRATLESVLERLPVTARDPGYVRAILEKVLTMLQEDNYISIEGVVAARRQATPITDPNEPDEDEEGEPSDDENDEAEDDEEAAE